MKVIRKILIINVLLFSGITVFCQSYWDKWNKNYNENSVTQLEKMEKAYADSVEKGVFSGGEYYLRMDKYRFAAIYLGERRKISETNLSSMKRVYAVYGNKEDLSTFNEIEHEFKFLIDGTEYWLALQPVLEKPFKKEIKENDPVYLYCLFLNEHTLKRELFNNYLISEFYKIIP